MPDTTRGDPRDQRTYAIIGAAMEVHRQLGGGFLEPVYQEAMAIEPTLRRIPHGRESSLPVHYKGRRLACGYRADCVCFDSVLVELEAVSGLCGAHQAQVINYLKATGHELGLLVNFGRGSLQYRRLIRSQDHLRKHTNSTGEGHVGSADCADPAD